MTVEEKANKYAEETILALYSDSELMQDFVQKQKKYAKVDFIAGYKEGQSNTKIKQLEWKETNYYIEARTKIGKYLTMSSDTSINSESRVQMYFGGTGEIIFDGTLGEAKAAAQADFEKRVKECLE